MSIPHLAPQGTKTLLYVHDKPFICLAGEAHNSDSSSPEYMQGIWQYADDLGMNTVLLPATWEMVEPEEGVFDFSIPEKLILQAREWGKKIIFLWFGSFKNAECTYTPAWVKTDIARFPRAQIVKGKNKAGRPIGANSPYTVPYSSLTYLPGEGMRADAKAFAAFMAFLKEVDEEENTVVAVQAENETGLLGAAREQSDAADAAFAGQVPADFAAYMKAHTGTMKPDVKEAVENGAEAGTWEEVFGPVAEEIFSAYHVASYVNFVAQAGKDVYPLPMFANCWLVKPEEKPGNYPSGGPVSRVHEVWDHCAPAIDVYCPDIYVPFFFDVCDDYSRRQPLAIPECATHAYCAPRLVTAVGHYHALCYAPFGFDDIGKPFTAMQSFLFGVDVTDPALKTPQNKEEYGQAARLLQALMPFITNAVGTSDLDASCAEKDAMATFIMGKTAVNAIFKSPMVPRTDGYCLAVRDGDEIYVMGNGCSLQLTSADPDNDCLDIVKAEELVLTDDGKLIPRRRFNGDETATLGFNTPGVIRLTTFVYR